MSAAQSRKPVLGSDAWLGDQTQVLIAAARAEDDRQVYAVAGRVAERSLAAAGLFALACDYATQRSQWSQAVRFATLQWRADPGDRPAAVRLIRLLRHAGAHDMARAVVEQLLAAAPNAADLLRLKLEILVTAGDTGTLEDEITEILASEAGDRLALHETVIQLLTDARAFDLAADVLEEARGRFGDSNGLERQRAMLDYRRGAFDEADRRWAALAERDPQLLRPATIYRARIALERGDRDAAEALYAQVLMLEPANVEAVRYVVRSEIRRGALDRAEAGIATYRGAAGEDANSLWLDALVLVARRDMPGATAIGAAALRRFPDDPGLALRIADLHSDAGDWQGAGAIIDTALARFPDDFALLGRSARAAEGMGSSPVATMEIVERALELRPTDESMLRSKANLLGRLGERRRAIETAIAAIEHHPRQVAFWRIAIAGLLNLSEPQRAHALVDRARETFAGASAADRIAVVEVLEIGELMDEAATAARAAIEAAPGDPVARMLAARISIARGRYREALPDLEALQALSERPGPDVMLRARVASAIAYVDAHPLDGATADIFPDALLARIARFAPVRSWEESAPMIVQVTAGLGAGGAERQLALTLRGQAARAREGAMRPILMAGDLNPLTGRDFFLSDVLDAGVEVVDLSRRRAEGSVRDLMAADLAHRHNIAVLGALPPEMGAIALPLYAELAILKPRVVHLWQDTTSIAGAMAAVLAGVPRIVIGTRSTKPVERQRARAWLAAGYHALMARPGTLVINNSRNGARDYEGWLDLPTGTIVPLYNGYEFGAMRARAVPDRIAEIRAQIGAAPGDPVFGGVMRLSFEKRPELWTATAIALAKTVPNLRGALVGEGPMLDQLKAMIAAEGLSDRIHLVGRQAPVEPWMKAMDVLFLSSLTEGLPNVLIEAQSLGVAVASMRIGGAPETMRDGETGILIDEGEPAEVAAKIAPLLLDGAVRARYGESAVRWTEDNFSDHAMLDRLTGHYAMDR